MMTDITNIHDIIKKTLAMMTGRNTSHQLQSITPHNLNTKNTTVIVMAHGHTLNFVVLIFIISIY